MSRAALLIYGDALSTSSRQDVVDYFKMALNNTMTTYEKGLHLLSSKGVPISAPTIPYPQKVDFVEKESFISVIGGKFRPLTAIEIKHLQVNINTNALGKSMMLGFSQGIAGIKLCRCGTFLWL